MGAPTIDMLNVTIALLVLVSICCFHLKRELIRMNFLRDTERKGRTSAERALRSGLQEKTKNEGINMREIGYIDSPFCDRRGTPRQGTVCPASICTLSLNSKTIPPASLDELNNFSHIWILFIFHENTDVAKKEMQDSSIHNDNNKKNQLLIQNSQKKKQGQQQSLNSTFVAKVTPPRLGSKVGVFSTRSPHRPNPIGLTVCSILKVDTMARTIVLGGVDFVHETPVLDIKPYIPYDSIPQCIVPQWVVPPNETDLTSSVKKVEISKHAEECLTSIFNSFINNCQTSQLNKKQTKKSKGYLRHYKNDRTLFEDCMKQVIVQDPRSLLLKKKDQNVQDPFKLTIDGIEISFVAESDNVMMVTQATGL